MLLAGGAWITAIAARSFAQTPAPRRIAFLHPGTAAGYRSRFDAFRAGLKDLGRVEGRDIVIEARWANDDIDRLPALAAEVVALKPAVIVTGTSAAVAALQQATSSIPIVFTTAADPIEQGFVASLRRPRGNITGIMVHSRLHEKIVEIAREALPKARRLAVLVHDADLFSKAVLESFISGARRFKFEPMIARVSRAEDFEGLFNKIVDGKADALYVPTLGFIISHHKQLVERSLKARLPLLSTLPDVTAAGGLLSYGTSREENFRRAAVMVDRILRGAKPADLPVEQPERFELVVNRKTAKAIGVSLPPATMQRADKVIE